MRPIAVGRKNWMFAGSNNGGHIAADIYLLIENAKMNNIKPHLYLQKVLATIQYYNHKKTSSLGILGFTAYPGQTGNGLQIMRYRLRLTMQYNDKN